MSTRSALLGPPPAPIAPQWCFRGPDLTLRRAWLLIALAMLAAPAWSHQDLLVQIEGLDIQLQADPANADLLAQRGDLYRRHQDYAAAATDFVAARSAQPDYPLLDFYEGLLLLDTGQPDAAEKSFSRYLLNQPQHAHAWELRAQCWLALGLPEKAAEDYSEAVLHADQPSPALYRDWALALVAAGEDHWSQARKAVDLALRHFPAEISLLALGTDTALAQGLPGEAATYIERLPEAVARLPRWHDRLELINCLEGDVARDSADECRRNAITLLRDQISQPST
ncbi:MAG: tetratricopeptide repeat protein [Lysobacterales bacterium]